MRGRTDGKAWVTKPSKDLIERFRLAVHEMSVLVTSWEGQPRDLRPAKYWSVNAEYLNARRALNEHVAALEQKIRSLKTSLKHWDTGRRSG